MLPITANSVYMTEMPPPYPGINAPYQGYAMGGNPQQPGAWNNGAQHNGAAWGNSHYNGQSHAGAYPNYGQPGNANYPPPYSTVPHQQGSYNSYPQY